MSIVIRDYKELQSLMTPEQKQKSKEMFDKFYGNEFGDCEPIYCGPEGRAAALGPEALAKYRNEEDLEEIELAYFDKFGEGRD